MKVKEKRHRYRRFSCEDTKQAVWGDKLVGFLALQQLYPFYSGKSRR